MSFMSDQNHIKILNDKSINIKTIYSDGKNTYSRNTNNSFNDNIVNSSIVEKDYYKDNKLLKKMYGFDPRIDYTYYNTIPAGTSFECVNCKMMVQVNDKVERCPFCGTRFRLEKKNKDFGTKGHYDRITYNTKSTIIIILLALFVSFATSYVVLSKVMVISSIKDILKVVGLGFIIALVLYFAFYIFDNIIVKLPVKIKKDKILKKDNELWLSLEESGIDYSSFYNNVVNELDKYYYVDNLSNIIDYDIIDSSNFKMNKDASNAYIDFTIIVREIRNDKDKIKINVYERNLTFKKNNKPDLDGDKNLIKCHNCGHDINITDEKCPSCDAYNNYKQEWYLIKIS